MRAVVPCSGRRTGADSIPAGPRFGGNYGAIPGLQAATAASSQRQDRAGAVNWIRFVWQPHQPNGREAHFTTTDLFHGHFHGHLMARFLPTGRPPVQKIPQGAVIV